MVERQKGTREPTRILISDCIAQEGIDLLRTQLPEAQIDVYPFLNPEQLKTVIGKYTALIVRSETQVTGDILVAARQLKVVGRAGVGVDNIDLEMATCQGIMIVNSPTSNIVAAAEHSIAMLMALARHIPAASNSMKAGLWEKSCFLGVEIRRKVLGIIGLGKVGIEVARRVQGLEMLVIASDPFVSPEQARNLGVALLPLSEVLKQADFITLHASLTRDHSSIRHLIGKQELQLIKPNARLINCARGALIDEEAVLNALNENRLAGAALDVFSQEPIRDDAVLRQLLAHERVIVTPHLGASTEEAQVGVAIDVAEQVIAALHGGFPHTAVNAPVIQPEILKVLQPYLHLLEQMGRLYTQLQPGPFNKIELSYSGEIANYDLYPLQSALIKGLLESISDVHINMVNAQLLAKQRELEIIEKKSTTPTEFVNLVTLRVLSANSYATSPASKIGSGDEHVAILSGTVVHGEPRIVHVGHYRTDFTPEGYILFCHCSNQPGIIGRIGTVLGKANVNIRRMDVEHTSGGHEYCNQELLPATALIVISVDDSIPQWAFDEIEAAGNIFSLIQVKLFHDNESATLHSHETILVTSH